MRRNNECQSHTEFSAIKYSYNFVFFFLSDNSPFVHRWTELFGKSPISCMGWWYVWVCDVGAFSVNFSLAGINCVPCVMMMLHYAIYDISKFQKCRKSQTNLTHHHTANRCWQTVDFHRPKSRFHFDFLCPTYLCGCRCGCVWVVSSKGKYRENTECRMRAAMATKAKPKSVHVYEMP